MPQSYNPVRSVIRRVCHSRSVQALRCRRGIAAVEFAVTATVLLSLLFGIIAFASTLYAYNMMEAGVSEAARRVAVAEAPFSASNITCGAGASNTAGTAENIACRSLPKWGTYTVNASLNCTSPARDAIVTITANSSTLALADMYRRIYNTNLVATATYRREGSCP